MTTSWRYDVAVLGLGPAGRILASRLAHAGVRVLAVDPGPDRRWHQTFGGWRRQLPSWLDEAAAGAVAERTVIRTSEDRQLFDHYVVLDTRAFQDSLPLDGVEVRRGLAAPDELAAEATVVVDCRGSRPSTDPGEPTPAIPAQSAFGVVLPADLVTTMLQGADAVLMDWTHPTGGLRWGRSPASFCYVIPLPDGTYLAEETRLAGRPALSTAELRVRLAARLRRHGIPASTMAQARSEEVFIPLVADPLPKGVLAFGTGGAQLNPISGYSVFASLAQADEAAVQLLSEGTLPTPGRAALLERRRALAAMLALDGQTTVALFDAFSRLPAEQQWAVLSPTSSGSELTAALGRQAFGMKPVAVARLSWATAAGRLGARGRR